jgi:hypothetical protein
LPNVNHNSLTDPYIHEPKGASTATSGQVYVANGSGSGTWTAHSAFTDANNHEPKGASTALAGQVYIANGAGSGSWVESHRIVGGYLTYSTGSPYAFSATTSDTVLNPTYTLSTNNGFTGLSSPNARIRYDGTETINASLDAVFSITQSSGSAKALELVFYKNGSVVTGSRMISTVANAEYHVITIKFNTTLATNDYIEVFGKIDSATTVNFVSGYLRILGTPA